MCRVSNQGAGRGGQAAVAGARRSDRRWPCATWRATTAGMKPGRRSRRSSASRPGIGARPDANADAHGARRPRRLRRNGGRRGQRRIPSETGRLQRAALRRSPPKPPHRRTARGGRPRIIPGDAVRRACPGDHAFPATDGRENSAAHPTLSAASRSARSIRWPSRSAAVRLHLACHNAGMAATTAFSVSMSLTALYWARRCRLVCTTRSRLMCTAHRRPTCTRHRRPLWTTGRGGRVWHHGPQHSTRLEGQDHGAPAHEPTTRSDPSVAGGRERTPRRPRHEPVAHHRAQVPGLGRAARLSAARASLAG